jgi:hypothetical protein
MQSEGVYRLRAGVILHCRQAAKMQDVLRLHKVPELAVIAAGLREGVARI